MESNRSAATRVRVALEGALVAVFSGLQGLSSALELHWRNGLGQAVWAETVVAVITGK